jgi:FixJ family two-component response regulator
MNLRYTCKVGSPARCAETPVVFVIDADAASRGTLEELIRAAGLVCRTTASAEEFLASPQILTPSCLLVDLNLPGVGGLELQRRVFDRTEIPIIFMSSRADVQATVRAMKAGAFDFLIKPFVGDVLLQAIRQAIERSRAAIRHLTSMRALQDRFESLSRRELEVLDLVVSGRLNKQVGGELGISEITVKAHRGKLMRKMQAGSFAELVNMAASLGRKAAANESDMDSSPSFAYHHRRDLGAMDSYGHA